MMCVHRGSLARGCCLGAVHASGLEAGWPHFGGITAGYFCTLPLAVEQDGLSLCEFITFLLNHGIEKNRPGERPSDTHNQRP